MLYRLLNALFHVLHVAIIAFVMFAWLYRPLLPAHLVLALLTLSCWFVLGHWLGRGYCPISDWHWKLKAALGEGRPSGTYIHQLLQKITRRQLNAKKVDNGVLIYTLAVVVISVVLNARMYLV